MALAVFLSFFFTPPFVVLLILGLWLLSRERRPVPKWKLNTFPPL